LTNETFLSLILMAVGAYFAVSLGRGLLGYLRFRRLRPTAVLTWPVPRGRNVPFLVGLGLAALGVALLNIVQGRPVAHVLSQVVTAAYFLLMVPLALRIRLGLYRDGVWADTGFLSWERIGRLTFVEEPEIMLVLVPRDRRPPAARLPVPREEYGAVRKLIDEKIRARVVQVEEAILGL
jgi:hypothetical protein